MRQRVFASVHEPSWEQPQEGLQEGHSTRGRLLQENNYKKDNLDITNF